MATPMALENTEYDLREKFYNEAENAVAHFINTGQRFTNDDIKDRVTTEPPHPNAWGGLHRQPWWKNKVRWSGDVKASRNKKSRNHIVKVWEAA